MKISTALLLYSINEIIWAIISFNLYHNNPKYSKIQCCKSTQRTAQRRLEFYLLQQIVVLLPHNKKFEFNIKKNMKDGEDKFEF